MSRSRHTDSYFAATALGAAPGASLGASLGAIEHPRLLGAVSCDVCVIGGGFTGLSTALHLAAASGSEDAVSLLLAGGADVNALDSARGQTPLMFAVANNRVEAIHALLDRGADVAITTVVEDMMPRQEADRAAGQRRNQALEAFRINPAPDRPVQRTNAPPPSQRSTCRSSGHGLSLMALWRADNTRMRAKK